MALLEVHNLGKSFGQTEAVRGVSFTIETGRCVALIGPNGAGKTTALKMLAGLVRPTRGDIYFAGQLATDMRQHLGYLPQNPGFHEWMSGSEFLVYVGRLAGLSQRAAKDKSTELLSRLGLETAAKRPIRGYSGGMRQRLGICQALVHDPQLLILDEPVSALDPVGRRQILELMEDLRTQTTILYSTHVLHDAEEISDDVLILRRGELVVSGALDDIQQRNHSPRVQITASVRLEPWYGQFAKVPGVKRIEGFGTSVTLTVQDVSSVRAPLLQVLLSEGVPVLRLELGRNTLEDLFMEAVSS
ncbi:ABC transporter ATP-binding protein [Alicyclobacillus sp. ALC3]|uniref:ABC transporter ATP-binding protein n=1 Tax=Alicyclobacillus sp. ALC3 TaxID=2796143 RepID=UPI002379FD63|nr:ABC transporter ATP-binding protein [Alicyclobacillus sp. ALC3]WDL98398.1 ABC transporter ATP-binding protein [Alicyclobacillus sp. ALC3]